MKLTIDIFNELLKTNTRKHPIDLSTYTIKSFIKCRLQLHDKIQCYVSINCNQCNTISIKNISRHRLCTLRILSYCPLCLRKQTSLLTYGVDDPNKSSIVKDKIKQTNLKRYGVTNSYQIQEVKEHCIATNITKSKEINDKRKQTNLEKYGVEYVSQSNDTKEKIKKTNLQRYHSENVFQSDIIKDKIKQNNMKKYGVESTNSLSDIKDKKKQTLLEHYGTLCTTHKYLYDDIYFDSFWELAFYIYHIDHNHNILREPIRFPYYVNHEKHDYIPDFKVNNRYYEIKGEQFIIRYKNGNIKTFCDIHKEITEISKAKYKCIKQHHIILITYKEIQKYLDYVYNNYDIKKLKRSKI